MCPASRDYRAIGGGIGILPLVALEYSGHEYQSAGGAVPMTAPGSDKLPTDTGWCSFSQQIQQMSVRANNGTTLAADRALGAPPRTLPADVVRLLTGKSSAPHGRIKPGGFTEYCTRHRRGDVSSTPGDAGRTHATCAVTAGPGGTRPLYSDWGVVRAMRGDIASLRAAQGDAARRLQESAHQDCAEDQGDVRQILGREVKQCSARKPWRPRCLELRVGARNSQPSWSRKPCRVSCRNVDRTLEGVNSDRREQAWAGLCQLLKKWRSEVTMGSGGDQVAAAMSSQRSACRTRQ